MRLAHVIAGYVAGYGALYGCTKATPHAPAPTTPRVEPVHHRAPMRATCERLDVEVALALPKGADDAQLVVDGEGAAHVIWPSFAFPHNDLHATYHHVREVDGAWRKDDEGLPRDVAANSFSVASDSTNVFVAIEVDRKGTYEVYRGPGQWIAQYATGQLFVGSAKVVDRATRPVVHEIAGELVVDYENNLNWTTKEPHERVTSIATNPAVSAIQPGDYGPVVDGDEHETAVIARLGAQRPRRVVIARNASDLRHCDEYAETCDATPFTRTLASWSSRAVERRDDVVAVGTAWTFDAPATLSRAPSDSRMRDRWIRVDDRGSGTLAVAHATRELTSRSYTTSFKLAHDVDVFAIAADASDRVHVLVRDRPVWGHPRYVRLGCASDKR